MEITIVYHNPVRLFLARAEQFFFFQKMMFTSCVPCVKLSHLGHFWCRTLMEIRLSKR